MENNCTIYKTVNIISKRWCLLIVSVINKGDKNKKRYSEIKKELKGITAKVLSSRLKELEKEGIIKKTYNKNHFPIKTYYSLTPSGKGLIKIIQDIKKWGLRFKFNNLECESTPCKICRF